MNPLLVSPAAPDVFAPSALVEAVAKLEQQRGLAQPAHANPPRLPLAAIDHEVDAFNVRGGHLDEYHLGHLGRSLSAVADLAPVLVLPCGGRFVLVDGHHRLAAYAMAGRPDIPVEVFPGAVREAVLEATLRNAMATLQMDNRHRQDCAWRLVNADFTLKEIVAAAGVSRAQVSVMRKTRKALGEAAAEFTDWWKAKRAAAGRPMEPLTDEEADAMLEAMALLLADKMGKAVGNKLSANPEVGAMAIAKLVGRMLPDIVMFLKQHLSADGLRYIEDEERDDFY